MYRQGDVLFIKINVLPEGVKKQKSRVIVYGEATGHHHSLVGGDIFTKDDLMYLVVGKNGQVTHQEHDTIKLEPGIYAVKRQREYLSSDMTRVVID